MISLLCCSVSQDVQQSSWPTGYAMTDRVDSQLHKRFLHDGGCGDESPERGVVTCGLLRAGRLSRELNSNLLWLQAAVGGRIRSRGQGCGGCGGRSARARHQEDVVSGGHARFQARGAGLHDSTLQRPQRHLRDCTSCNHRWVLAASRHLDMCCSVKFSAHLSRSSEIIRSRPCDKG